MERTFSVVISELRKENGLSQKDASLKLGISQALLSHYEKGIRECGQDFLIRAADFYGVTCDYLLGRTTTRTMFGEALNSDNGIHHDDSKLSTQTVFRATAAVREQLQKIGNKDFDLFHAIALYNVMVNEVNLGNLPSSWAGDTVEKFSPVYQYFMFSISQFVFNSSSKKVAKDAPIPECVQTIAREVTKFMRSEALKVLPVFNDEDE